MRQPAIIFVAVLVAVLGTCFGVYLSEPKTPTRHHIILPAQRGKAPEFGVSQYVYRNIRISSLREKDGFVDLIGSNEQYQIIQLVQVQTSGAIRVGDTVNVRLTSSGLSVELSP